LSSIIKVDQIQSDTGVMNLSSGLIYVDQNNRRVGIGNTSPSQILEVTDAAPRLNFISTNNESGIRYNTDGTATNSHRWQYQGVTQMGLTSGGTLDLPYGQIKFPASQNASSDPNTLDDYEEGTWSPRISDNTTSSGVGLGHYRKIGNLVIAQFQFYNADISAITAGNALYLTGLPYVNGSSGASHQLLSTPTNTLYGSILAHDVNGTTTAQLYYSGGTDRVNWNTLTRTAWGGSSVSLYGTYIYRAAN
jgi:hypothetical protein